MTYEDAEYVVKQLKQAKIECYIDIITCHDNKGTTYTYHVHDVNDKNICIMNSDMNEIEFIMSGALKFDSDSTCCDPVNLYRFGNNKEDLKMLIDEFIVKHKNYQKIKKLFNSEIHRLRKDLREVGHNDVHVKAKVEELNKNMYDAYKIQEIDME